MLPATGVSPPSASRFQIRPALDRLAKQQATESLSTRESKGLRQSKLTSYHWPAKAMIALDAPKQETHTTSSQPRIPLDYRLLLGTLGLATFLTQVKFVPTIKNNIGPFELVGAVLIMVFLFSPRTRRPLQHPPLSRILAAMLLISFVSQINIPDGRETYGLIHVAIMAFLYLFILVNFNLIHQYQIEPERVLSYVCHALLIVGPWILYQGLTSTATIQEAGPFRNRAHMASYMLTAFWMALMFAQWPGISKRKRLVAYLGVTMTLYCVAVSGRRSVYLSLFVGLAVLAIAFLIAQRGKRTSFFVAAAFVVVILGFMYQYGSRYMPQLAFFKERVGMIDDRLDAALGITEDEARDKSFFALQQAGVRRAFSTHPFIGIGWGGFAKSHYSPTSHEVHSTPMRFLAETGLVGIILYVLFLIVLVGSVIQSFLRARGTPFSNSFLVLCVGLVSMVISYLYNRHVTERTFWILLVVIVASDLSSRRLRGRKDNRAGTPLDVSQPPARSVAGSGSVGVPLQDSETPWPASST